MQRIKEFHSDFEQLLAAKYTELKLMIPVAESTRSEKLIALQSEIKKVNNWIEVTTLSVKTMTDRIEQCEVDLFSLGAKKQLPVKPQAPTRDQFATNKDPTPQNTPPRANAASQMAFKSVQPSDSRPDIAKTPTANPGSKSQAIIKDGLNEPSEKSASLPSKKPVAGNIDELSPINVAQDASIQPYQDYSKDAFDQTNKLNPSSNSVT